MPADLYEWRNLTTTFLRRDLDVLGLDSYDFGQDSTLLAKLEQELGSVSDKERRLISLSASRLLTASLVLFRGDPGRLRERQSCSMKHLAVRRWAL